MKKLLLVGLLLMVCAFATRVNADCRILSVENVATDKWRILVSLADLPAGEFFFRGQAVPNGPWVSYPGTVVDGVGVVNFGWVSGDSIEFSYGTIVNGDENWTDPNCSEHLFEGHFRLKLGERRTANIVPMLSAILLNEDAATPTPIACVTVVEKNTNGALGDYEITLSLQHFVGAPINATPYVDRQQAPGSAWTGFLPVTRQGNKAILTVLSWPRGSAMEFAYKLVSGQTTYWQDLGLWQGECAQYIFNDHLRVVLGN